ncbi:hypothetical protein ABTF93_19050, partial [Acinetobacter baumannii]
MIEWLQGVLKHSPEILLFLSLAIGFWIGQFQFGKFQFGGVAGSLLVAVVLSLIGVPVDNGVKAILFALFIYAVGFESGPQFSLYTTNFTEPLSYQGSAFLKLPKF